MGGLKVRCQGGSVVGGELAEPARGRGVAVRPRVLLDGLDALQRAVLLGGGLDVGGVEVALLALEVHRDVGVLLQKMLLHRIPGGLSNTGVTSP